MGYCEKCKTEGTVKSVLEGISVRPLSKKKKFFYTGAYGINAQVCTNCGRITCIELGNGALEVLKKLASENR